MTRPRPSARARPAVGVLVVALLASVACTSKSPPSARPAPSDTPTPSASPSASPVPAPRASPSAPRPAPSPVDPLRGLDPYTGNAARGPVRPVVVLKVDNSPLAWPYQRGLAGASVVYVELIEGGETRFAAVYEGAPSVEVGPIRSARETDLQLLGQYGAVALGFSGANRGTRRSIAKAVAAHRLYDASYYTAARAYRLAEQRADARNFFTNPGRLSAARPRAVRPHDVGLRFGPQAAGTGLATASLHASFSSASTYTVTYVARTGAWQVREGRRVVATAANVIVQRVKVGRTRYHDTLGNPTPFSTTLGKGQAVVLRDGRRIPATWARPGLAAGTHYRDRSGHDIPLKPGRTWVLLLPSRMPVTVR